MTPFQIGKSWYVNTPDGRSGPWRTEDAAQAAANDDFTRANFLNNQAKSNGND